MRLLLVDDHPIFLTGLHRLLTANGFDVVGTARDGFDALAQVRCLSPDVVVMDIRMPRCDGLAGTRLIKAEFPQVRVVILSGIDDDEVLFDAIRAGASGYLLKWQDGDDFLSALRDLAHGAVALAPGLAERILGEFSRLVEPAHPDGAPAHELSPRQVQVLSLTARGLTYKQVGCELGIAERTVKY